MAILKFEAAKVAALIAHAQACSTFMHKWDGPVDEPRLILVVGNGVHLISNGLDGSAPATVKMHHGQDKLAYAVGLNPFTDIDWITNRRNAFRDMTGNYQIDKIGDIQTIIDRGHKFVRLATDGHTVRVFAQTTSDYLLGGIYKVPSGLGGVFHVTLLDIHDTYALVKNTGNCEDFDEMQPYRVSLDLIAEIDQRRAA